MTFPSLRISVYYLFLIYCLTSWRRKSTSCKSHWHLSLKHHLQLFYLLCILTKESILGIFIYLWFILNELRSACITQSAQSFIIVIVSWRSSSDHNSFGISSKRILQQTGKLWISIRNMMSFSIDQSRNNISQSTQREIDFCRLFHAIPSRPSFACPFRPSKIN